MVAAGLPAGFQTNLGGINGDGTGDGSNSGLPAATPNGSLVKVQHPAVLQLANNAGSGDPWVWQTQERFDLYTNNARGQETTHTDPEGNVTVTVRYPWSDPEGNGQFAALPQPGVAPKPTLNSQYGNVKEVHEDVNPADVMDLAGPDADMLAFTGNIIPRTNAPGVYKDLVTRYDGGGAGAAGCPSCAYDPLGNALAKTDPNGNTNTYQRNEMGEEYGATGPAPYNIQIQYYFDANRNSFRDDVRDLQPAFLSGDATDAAYAQLALTGNGQTSANLQFVPGPGGSLRPGWFSNLRTYDLLDEEITEDIDATGATVPNLLTTRNYDSNQNLTRITKPNGNIVEYDYDERNLRIAIRDGFDPAKNFPGAVTIFINDPNGIMVGTVGPMQRGTAANSLTVTIADAFNSGANLTQTGDYIAENGIDGFDRTKTVTNAVGGVTTNTFDPVGNGIAAVVEGTAGGATPTDRLGGANVVLQSGAGNFDEASRQYEIITNVLLNTLLGNAVPSGRTITHTGGGLETNSPTNGHTAVANLTAGETSYTLQRTVFDRAGRTTAVGSDNGAIATTQYDGRSRHS